LIKKSSTRRSAFTIYEVLIAAAISSILTLVLYNTLLSGTRTAEKNMETLGYLRDASLLMEYIKTDIRNAPRGDFAIEGSNPELLRSVPNGVPVQVSYTFDPAQGIVTRTIQGRSGKSTNFGRGRTSGMGTIVEFAVTKVANPESPEPFYQIVVGFASPRLMGSGHRTPTENATPPQNHRVQALVSRRTPAERADKWNTTFEE
jgi:type II secretory pathway pseudopilin PulG